MPNVNSLLVFVLSVPACAWLTVLVHELAHWLCFVMFGYYVKEIKIGLLLVKCAGTTKLFSIAETGFFQGFCAIEKKADSSNYKLIFPLMAGGISGLVITLVSLILLVLKLVPRIWRGFFAAFVCVGIYSFYTTLIRKRSADRKLIDKIMNEEMKR